MLGDVQSQISLWGVKGAFADPLVGIPFAFAVIALHLFLTRLGQNPWQMIRLLVALGNGRTYALPRCTRRISWADLGFPWVCHGTLGHLTLSIIH